MGSPFDGFLRRSDLLWSILQRSGPIGGKVKGSPRSSGKRRAVFLRTRRLEWRRQRGRGRGKGNVIFGGGEIQTIGRSLHRRRRLSLSLCLSNGIGKVWERYTSFCCRRLSPIDAMFHPRSAGGLPRRRSPARPAIKWPLVTLPTDSRLPLNAAMGAARRWRWVCLAETRIALLGTHSIVLS